MGHLKSLVARLQHSRFLNLAWLYRAELGVGGVVLIVIAGAICYVRYRRRPSAEAIECRRRDHLMKIGRLIDGSIVETSEENGEREVIFTYRVAGVQYTCSQDLTALNESAQSYRVDLPVQVRYDPRNPFNSIVAAEGWRGLRAG